MALPYNYQGNDPGRSGANIGTGGMMGSGLGGGGGGMGGFASPLSMGSYNNIGEMIGLLRKRFPNLQWAGVGESRPGYNNVDRYGSYSKADPNQLAGMDAAAGSARGGWGGPRQQGGPAQGFGEGGPQDMLKKLLAARMGGGF